MLFECALYSRYMKQTGSVYVREPSIYKMALTGVNQLYDSLALTKPGTPYANKKTAKVINGKTRHQLHTLIALTVISLPSCTLCDKPGSCKQLTFQQHSRLITGHSVDGFTSDRCRNKAH